MIIYDIIDNLNQKDKYQLMNKLSFLFQGGALFDSLNCMGECCIKLLNTTSSLSESS